MRGCNRSSRAEFAGKVQTHLRYLTVDSWRQASHLSEASVDNLDLELFGLLRTFGCVALFSHRRTSRL